MERARIDNEPKLFCKSSVSNGQEINALDSLQFPIFISLDLPLIPAIVSIISISGFGLAGQLHDVKFYGAWLQRHF
jgi:hypothetical protein